MRFVSSQPARLSVALLSLSVSSILYAQSAPTPTTSDWGGVGLLQTPTARMADEGELSFTASHTSPYSRYTISLQPLPWLEGSFRYISVANRRYGSPDFSGNLNYKDKSIDLKIRLIDESRWLPEISVGARDIGGTGLFSSEYVVANKNFGPFDTSLGMATGYIGNRGDFSNPLRLINEKFEERPTPSQSVVNAGNLNSNASLRGPIGLFGGVSYQTPWEALVVKIEYDGNDYKSEPQKNNQPQKSAINVGVSYAANSNVQLHLGWERGNTAMFAITLHGNLLKAVPVRKIFDPDPPELPLSYQALAQPHTIGNSFANDAPTGALRDIDWAALSSTLETNAGIRVSEIASKDHEIIIRGEQRRFLYPAQGLGRAARIVARDLPNDIQWVTVENTRLGVPIASASVNSSALLKYIDNGSNIEALARNTEFTRPIATASELLYSAPIKRLHGAFNLGYRQTVGGPDGFILYQVSGTYDASFHINRNLWVGGTASYNAYNNYDKFRYDAPSKLPRVRTDLRQYLTTTDFTIPNLQVTGTQRLGNDLYGMAYAGLLESMYGGVGAEILYRPIGERWSIGAELNWVKQRDFDQRFSFRNYSVSTGHASFYYTWGDEHRVLTAISAGRYLARDWGATLGVSRLFDNGVTMGAYATKTDASAADFGEGSFDKGIYVSVPFDFMLPRSTRARANFLWNPLYRDGGARLARANGLYQMTSERDSEFFYDNLSKIRD